MTTMPSPAPKWHFERVSTLLEAQRGLHQAELTSVRRRARRALLAFGVAAAIAVGVAALLGTRSGGDTAELRRLDALAAAQTKTIAGLTQRAAAAERRADTSTAAAVAHADRADAAQAAIPRVTLRPAAETHTPATVYPVIDSSWVTVRLSDDPAPHYADTTLAGVLARLSALALDYEAFRGLARIAIADAKADADAQRALVLAYQDRLTTETARLTETRKLIPTRRQQLWHDVKVAGGTIVIVKGAEALLRVLAPP